MNLENLTIEQAREIEAGAECDDLIHQVCGWIHPPREPSTDANAAIEAAKSVGFHGYTIQSIHNEPVLATIVDNKGENDAWGEADKPALSLCRAILVRAVERRETDV